MHALSATNAALVVDAAESVFIVIDGIARTGLFTGTGQVGNGTVGSGLCPHSAFLTLHRLNVCSLVRHRNRTEMTAVLAGFSQAKSTVIRYGVGGNRTLFTSGIDNLDDIGTRT